MLVILAAARRESRGWEQAGFVIRPERSQISGSMTALACWQQLSQGHLCPESRLFVHVESPPVEISEH
jgi:hypothetical protein